MILEVKNINKTFKKDKSNFKALNNISFEINEGECLGIIGESGSGKSTIANIVAGLLSSDDGEVIFLDAHLPNKISRKGQLMRKEMQMVFQNPIVSFNPKMTVFDSVAEGLRYNTKKSKKEIEQLVNKTLEIVDFPIDYINKRCCELSGGMAQRVAIARGIIIEPKLLICDEITSSLDVSVQAQIIKLLDNLKNKLNISYLFISHDLALVSGICDRVIVIKNGNIVESGVTYDVLNSPKHEYTKLLINSVLSID